MDLRNTKIDLRRPDGSIDKEKSAAFFQLATGGDVKKYCGWRSCGDLDINDYFLKNAYFVVVGEDGMVSLIRDDGEYYFKSDKLGAYREVICEPEYFIAFKQSDEELARDSKIAELSAQLKKIQTELSELKSGVK